MHGRLILILAFALLALARSAHADVGVGGPSGSPWPLCAAQTATGACTESPASGEERVATVDGFSTFTAFAEASTATTFTCQIISNDEGHDDATADGDGTVVATLTQASRQARWPGPDSKLFVTCNPITGGNVTITVRGVKVTP